MRSGRTVSMPLEVYEADLKGAEQTGKIEALRRFIVIIGQAKKEPRDAIIMIVEEFEGDQLRMDQLLKALGLFETAEKIWRKNE